MDSLNYFNYFPEIEQFFQSKRGAFTLLSPLDWVLIENWKEQGIPLETVLKGIDRAFSRKKSGRDIASLAYCVKAVDEVVAEGREMRIEKPVLPEVPANEVSAYVEKMASGVGRLSLVLPEFSAQFEAMATALKTLDVSSLRHAEQTLGAMEEKLIALLKVASDAKVLLEVKKDVDGNLNPFRSTMTAEQLAMVEQQLWRRMLMERYDVPRLSLFYLL